MTRGFGALWSANAMSNLADGLAFVAMPLLAASLTDDPRLVAGLATVYAAVRLFVAVPVGVYVDRLDRRTLIVTANLVRAGAVVVLGASVQFGFGSLALLYLATAVVGTLESAVDNAAVAILPSLVRPDDLDRANSRVSAAQLVADEFAGPPLGGLLFAASAAFPVFAMGGLWAAAGVTARALPGQPRATAGGPTGAWDGVRWAAGDRTVGSLALVGGLASVGYMVPFSILVLFADERLGLDGTGYGVILAVSALGGLVGTAVAAPVRDRIGYRWTIVASLCLGAASLAALSVTTDAVVAAGLLAVYILHAVVWGVCSVSLRQRLVPDGLRGRVNAATRVVGLLGLALGSVVGGVLATVDVAVPVAVGAAVFVGCAVVAAVALRGTDTLLGMSTNGGVADAQRAAVLDLVDLAYVEGFLDSGEHETRRAGVAAAATVADLHAQVSDLPPQFHWRPAPPAPPGQPPPRPARGVAVASIVLGTVSVPMFLCLGAGAIVGVAAVLAGVRALRDPAARTPAIVGIVLGAVGIVVGLGFVALLIFSPDETTVRTR